MCTLKYPTQTIHGFFFGIHNKLIILLTLIICHILFFTKYCTLLKSYLFLQTTLLIKYTEKQYTVTTVTVAAQPASYMIPSYFSTQGAVFFVRLWCINYGGLHSRRHYSSCKS